MAERELPEDSEGNEGRDWIFLVGVATSTYTGVRDDREGVDGVDDDVDGDATCDLRLDLGLAPPSRVAGMQANTSQEESPLHAELFIVTDVPRSIHSLYRSQEGILVRVGGA